MSDLRLCPSCGIYHGGVIDGLVKQLDDAQAEVKRLHGLITMHIDSNTRLREALIAIRNEAGSHTIPADFRHETGYGRLYVMAVKALAEGGRDGE